jgi:FkbM family methyltransferase
VLEVILPSVGGKLARLLRSSKVYPMAAAVKRWGVAHNPFHIRRQRMELELASRFYRAFIKPGDLCFDVGAHQGVRTDVFLNLGARVVAVEPQAHLADGLRTKYRHDDRVTVVAKGLDEKEGQTTLYVCNYSTCSSMNKDWIDSVKRWERLQGREWNDEQTVAVTTLDRLIEERGLPVFCKVDVEGFEWHVLKGLTQKVPALSLEYNPRHLSVAQRCVGHLTTLGAYEFNYSEGDSMELALPAWVTAEAMYQRIRDVLPGCNVYGDIYARLRA